MLQMPNRRTLLKAVTWASIVSSATSLFAQWGVNAQPCFDGRCAPVTRNVGILRDPLATMAERGLSGYDWPAGKKRRGSNSAWSN